MKEPYILWGQIGATFHLTDVEMELLLRFDQDSAELFSKLVRERRYEIDGQFYAPEFETGEDIFIHLNETDRSDAVWLVRDDSELYPRKIWCRTGVSFSLNDQQMQILKRHDYTSAELIFDLTDSGQYETWGSCLFESDNQVEGFDEPEEQCYIDLYQDGTPPSVTTTETGIKFN